MAKRKKQPSKVQKRKAAKARPKSKKLSKAARGKAAAKRAVAKAKPKRAPVKKAAPPVAATVETIAKVKPKRAPVKKAARPVGPVVETTVFDVIEKPGPGVIAVTEFEETVVREESPGPG